MKSKDYRHPFLNMEKHFEPYLKVRDRVSEEIRYRRDRQWEMVKWSSLTMIGITTALITLKSKSADTQPLALWIVSTLIILFLVLTLITIVRILHESRVYGYLSKVCSKMDKTFNVHFSSRDYKLTTSIETGLRRTINGLMDRNLDFWRILWRGETWASRRSRGRYRMAEKSAGWFYLHWLHSIIVILVFIASSLVLIASSRPMDKIATPHQVIHRPFIMISIGSPQLGSQPQ